MAKYKQAHQSCNHNGKREKKRREKKAPCPLLYISTTKTGRISKRKRRIQRTPHVVEDRKRHEEKEGKRGEKKKERHLSQPCKIDLGEGGGRKKRERKPDANNVTLTSRQTIMLIVCRWTERGKEKEKKIVSSGYDCPDELFEERRRGKEKKKKKKGTEKIKESAPIVARKGRSRLTNDYLDHRFVPEEGRREEKEKKKKRKREEKVTPFEERFRVTHHVHKEERKGGGGGGRGKLLTGVGS